MTYLSGSSTREIDLVSNSFGEAISLNSRIRMTGSIANWGKRLLASVGKTVKAQHRLALQHLAQQNVLPAVAVTSQRSSRERSQRSSIDVSVKSEAAHEANAETWLFWLKSYNSQSLVLAVRTIWHASVNAVLTGPRQSRKRGLQSYCMKWRRSLETVRELLTGSLSSSQRNKLSQVLLTVFEAEEMLQHLVTRKVLRTDDFSWVSLPRFSNDLDVAAEDDVTYSLNLGPIQLELGDEFYGYHTPFVWTSSCRQNWLRLVTIMELGYGVQTSCSQRHFAPELCMAVTALCGW